MFGGLLMILFWLLIIAVIAAAVKYLFGGRRGPYASRTARDLLDEAYARGEISRDEYFQKRDDLQKK
jgi:putative membrane protein